MRVTSLCLWSIAALIGLQEVLDPVLPHDVQTLLLLALMAAVEHAVAPQSVRIVLSAELMPNRYRSLGMSLGNAVGWGLALLSLMFFPCSQRYSAARRHNSPSSGRWWQRSRCC